MFRFTRASWLFSRILFSYLWLLLRIKLFGYRRMKAAGRRTHRRNARRLYRGFLRLRGVYIKIGQVLSVLGSFLPPEFIEALEGLQDEVPAQPYRRIRRAFLRDRGRPPEEVFATFEKIPIAAASLGQVHLATLKTGEKAAVKVLYPNIHRIIRIDLRVVRRVLRVYKWFAPTVQNIENVLDQLADVLSRETNYTLEALNMRKLAEVFEDDPAFDFPKVYDNLSSRGILVMSFMDGLKITAVDEYEALGIDRTEVATLLVKSFYKQFLIDGIYHADPHPGNFLVSPGPVITFLDFGAVEPVRDNLRKGMIEFLTGMISKDDDKAIDGIETMGFVAPGGNRALLEETVRHYFQKLVTLKIEDYSRLDVRDFVSPEEMRQVRSQLRELMRSISYPEGWFYIERSLLLLFGVCAILDPKVNSLELGFPYAMQYIINANQPPAAEPAAEAESLENTEAAAEP